MPHTSESVTSPKAAVPRDKFACVADATPLEVPLSRLSKHQYGNAVRDLTVWMMPPSVFHKVWGEVASDLDYVPSDVLSKRSPFGSMDQTVSQQHVDAQFRLAEHLASALTRTPERVDALLHCERDGLRGEPCVEAFMRWLFYRAFHVRPNEEDVRTLWAVYGAAGIDPAGLNDVITYVLTSPRFVYQVELGATAVEGADGVSWLSGYEVAARLSLLFWQTEPDHLLLEAAERGELSTSDGLRRQVERLLDDERSREGLAVFAREWLHLDDLPEMHTLAGTPAFDAFRGSSEVHRDLREAMIDDVVDAFVFHVQRGDSYAAFLTSPLSFARDPALASIYGVEAWSRGSAPPRFPEGERAGLITRAALVSSGKVRTRPIMKGVFIRERLLCDRLPPPPANASSGQLESRTDGTTRQVVEGLTEQPGSSCAFCHSSRINALGYATEDYDGLGRYRTEQKLFSEKGKVLGSHPVNTKSVPHVWPDDERESSGAAELTAMIVESGKGEKCFALQFARFALGRKLNERVDGCLLEQMRADLRGGVGLRESIIRFVLRPEFRQRYVGEMQ